ncbi:MAG: 3-hydroxyacyl-ACP dehydratase FabZ family protein [Opitutales bacterium]
MDEILRTIPHRPPFLFVDTIVELREDGAICQRTLREDEDFFGGHYPGNPIMPGVLMCEAVFQTGAIYLGKQLEAEGGSLGDITPVLSRIKDARFKNMVKPGDTLTIEVKLTEKVSHFSFLKGVVKREDGKVAVTIDFALAMVKEAAK